MKKKCEKLFWIVFSIIAVMLFVFVIPIVINWLYSRPASIPLFAMSWEAKDALAFYGSILGAGATILALVATIRFTTNNQKGERKLAIKPYLQTKFILKPSFDSIFKGDLSYFAIGKGIVEGSPIPFDELREIKRLHDKYKCDLTAKGIAASESFKEKYKDYFSKNYVFIYEIVNCGAGNAVDVNVTIDNIPIREGFCVSTVDSVKFVIVISGELAKIEKFISIHIEYSDVCSLARYAQSECFRLLKDDNDEFTVVRYGEDLLTQPREILNRRNNNGET